MEPRVWLPRGFVGPGINDSDIALSANRSDQLNDIISTAETLHKSDYRSYSSDHWLKHDLPIIAFLLTICLSVVLGLTFMSLCRMRRDRHLPQNYGALLIFVAVLFGALITKIQEDNKWQVLSLEDVTVLYHIAAPLLCFYSGYIIPMHLLTWGRVREMGFYALLSILVPSFLVALVYQGIYASIDTSWEWTDNQFIISWWMVGFGAMMGESVSTGFHLESMGRTGQLLLFLEGEFLVSAAVMAIAYNTCHLAVSLFPFYLILLNLLSFPIILIIGEFCLYVLKRLHRNKIRNTLMFLTSIYLAHLIPEACKFSGPSTVCLLGVFLSRNTMNIDAKIISFFEDICKVFYYGATHMVYFLSGCRVGQTLYHHYGLLQEIGWIALLALICFLLRLIGVMLCWLLGRTCKCIDSTLIKETVKIFGNISGPLSLLIGLAYVSFLNDEDRERKFYYLTGVVFFSLVIKGTLFPLLTYHMCINRQEIKAMHLQSLKHKLGEVRRQEMLMISQDRFLAEARWDMVEQAYKEIPSHKSKHVKGHARVEQKFQSVIRYLQSSRSLLEKTVRRKIRVALLRSQLASYLRHHQDGQLSAWAMRLLMSATSDTLNARETIVPVDHFKFYFKMSPLWDQSRRFLRGVETRLKIDESEITHPPPPSGKFRKFFYHLDHSIMFEMFVYLVLVTHMMITFAELPYQFNKEKVVPKWFAVMNKIFYSFYIVEFVIKVLALGRNTFHTRWNYLDCLFAIISAVDLFLELFLFKIFKKHQKIIRDIQIVLLFIRLLKLIRFVKILIPGMIRWCELQMNRKLTKSYEILRGLLCSEDDALRIMNYIVETELTPAEVAATEEEELTKIVEALRFAHKVNRLTAVREITRLTMSHAKIVCAVKTRTSLIYLFETLRRKVESWRHLGEIDHGEYHYLMHYLLKSETRALSKIKPSLRMPDVEDIIDGVSWIEAGGEEVKDIIIKESIPMQLTEGEILFEQGSLDLDASVYIVIHGLLKLTITMNNEQILDCHYGMGSCIGEIAVLTGSPRSGQVSAFTDTDLLVVPNYVIKQLVADYPTMSDAMIKDYCTKKVYSDVFILDPRYQGFTESRIKSVINDGNVIDLLDVNVDPSGYWKEHEDDFVILVKGCCMVDKDDHRPPRTNVIIRATDNCKLLPSAARHISRPPARLFDENSSVYIWLFVMPRPDTSALRRKDLAATASTIEMLDIERKGSMHLFEVPNSAPDIDSIRGSILDMTSRSTSHISNGKLSIPLHNPYSAPELDNYPRSLSATQLDFSESRAPPVFRILSHTGVAAGSDPHVPSRKKGDMHQDRHVCFNLGADEFDEVTHTDPHELKRNISVVSFRDYLRHEDIDDEVDKESDSDIDYA